MPNITRIGNGLKFDPQTTSPLLGEKGELYYNDLLGWRYHNGVVERNLEVTAGSAGESNPLSTYRVRIKEDCSDAVGSGTSKLVSQTTATSGNGLFQLAVDKTKTCTVISNTYSISSAPGFTLQVGDVIFKAAVS